MNIANFNIKLINKFVLKIFMQLSTFKFVTIIRYRKGYKFNQNHIKSLIQ